MVSLKVTNVRINQHVSFAQRFRQLNHTPPLLLQTMDTIQVAMLSAESSLYEKLSEGDVLAIWTQVTKHFALQTDECQMTDFAPCKKNSKYTQVRYKKVKYYCHIIGGMMTYKRAPKHDEEASHLCHNSGCVAPKHIVFETGDVNKSRLCCKLYGQLEGYKCPHKPTCFFCTAL